MYASAATIIASAVLALAQTTAEKAIIIVEASHGGAGSGLTNATLSVDMGPIFTGDDALKAVSSLYLVGAIGVDVDAVTCTPFKNTDGTGTGGLPFNSTTPSRLSTNTVVVGSIVCNTDA
jgi:hypothetical protein